MPKRRRRTRVNTDHDSPPTPKRRRRTRVNTYHDSPPTADPEYETLVQQDIACPYAPYGCTDVFQSTRACTAHRSRCSFRSHAQMVESHSNPDSRTNFSVAETRVDVPNASMLFDRWLNVAPTQTYHHYNHILGRPCRSTSNYNDHTRGSINSTSNSNQHDQNMNSTNSGMANASQTPPAESDEAYFGGSGDIFEDDHAWDRMDVVYERHESSTIDGGSFGVHVSGPRDEECFRNAVMVPLSTTTTRLFMLSFTLRLCNLRVLHSPCMTTYLVSSVTGPWRETWTSTPMRYIVLGSPY